MTSHAIKKRKLSKAQKAKAIKFLVDRNGRKCHYCHHRLASPQDIEACSTYTWYDLELKVFLQEGDDRLLERRGKKEMIRGCSVDLPEHLAQLTVDHKVAHSKGGSDNVENLVLCCMKCNVEKSNRYTYEEFRAMTAGDRKCQSSLVAPH